MALFRSNRGMHLLTLPTTHADAENTRRKNIQDGGTTTASRLLAQARILPQEALVCGPPGRIFPAVESLQRKSSRPFVLIGTARDLTDSPLLRLPVQWIPCSRTSFRRAAAGLRSIPASSAWA